MRDLLKQTLEFVALVLASPFWLLAILARPFDRSDGVFRFCSQSVSLVPGGLGNFTRRGFYRMALETKGSFTIEFGTIFALRGSRIGANAYIGANCNIGLADIGRDCLLGSNVHLIAGKQVHFFDRIDVPIRLQGGRNEMIRVGEGAWLGNGALVMADVGEGCVVGAGSVVTKPCDPFWVYAGNPARPVKDRRLG